MRATVKDIKDDYVDLLWTTKSTKAGDDEAIVFEIGYLLDVPDRSWKIIWSESEYRISIYFSDSLSCFLSVILGLCSHYIR